MSERKAVSKRLRYEVFRRDGFRCRYCGAGPDDCKLTVDHVVPDALGGDTKPENLVTACADCNAGKASSSPDAEIVANVADDALRWGQAMRRAAETQGAQRDERREYGWKFDDVWTSWHDSGGAEIPRPQDWRNSIERFHAAGLELPLLLDAVATAMESRATNPKKFRYFCGVCWNILRERQEMAQALLTVEDAT